MKKTSASAGKQAAGFSAEERAAMRERVREMKADAAKANGEAQVLEKIAAMAEPDRGICERLHALIKANAPGLAPKTWYGMPAYANQEGKVICFFRESQRFKERYLTLGFNQEAQLDDGTMWPIAYALTELTPENEVKIAELVKRAAGEP